MKKIMVLTMVVVLLLTSGCAMRAPERAANESEVSYDEAYSSAEAPAQEQEGGRASVAVADVPDLMIIYTGSLDLVVKDTQEAQDEVGKLVEQVGGYVASSESYRYEEGWTRVTLTLRVPSEKFNDAMSELRALAIEVSHDSVSSENVTQSSCGPGFALAGFGDQGRAAGGVDEGGEDTEAVLAVYQELSATQQEIEQVKGRMQYLERSAAMATITVSLTPDELAQPIEVAGWRPQGTVKRAVQALINTYQFLFDALIWIVLLVIPVLAGIGLVVYGIVKALAWLLNRRKPRQPKKVGPPSGTPQV
jgi:uncharacterized protein YceK